MPIDLSRITTDTYVAAGLTDHITPWQATGSSRFPPKEPAPGTYVFS